MHLVGPDAIAMWVEHFPTFCDRIYDYLLKPKLRAGRMIRWDHAGAPTRDEFNICMFMDATIYLTCRLGVGPMHGGDNAPR